jgi:peptide/nickel transport system permease protein
MLIAIVIGIPLGLLSAWHEGSRLDRALTSISLVGQSVPAFWLGLMAILIFAVNLGWFPAGGYGSPQQLILPAVTLALLPLAQLARLTRSAAVDVLHEPFMTAAQARGVPTRTLVPRHLVRNVMLPVLSLTGLQVGGLLSGAVTVEIVFGWPGMGALAVQAVQFRDFPLVQAIVVVGAFVFVLVNLLVDLLYGLIDPRIRVSA